MSAYDPYSNPGGQPEGVQSLQEMLYNNFLQRQGGFRGVRGTGTDIVGPGGAAFGGTEDVKQLPGGGLISGFLDPGLFSIIHHRRVVPNYITRPQPGQGGGDPTNPFEPKMGVGYEGPYVERRGRRGIPEI